MSSVRDYAILWVGAGKGGAGGTALGGNALLTTAQHKLDGLEHLTADDTARLDATVDEHGLLPKLSGVTSNRFDGAGFFRDVEAAEVLYDPSTSGLAAINVQAAIDLLAASGGTSSLPIFQFEDFGAVGDGTTDDALAMQATIDAIDAAGGGILLVGPKCYATSATLHFAGPTYRVAGVGSRYGPSCIKMLTANTTALSFVTTTLSGFRIETSSVENLKVIGPGTSGSPATSGRGIYASSDVFCHEVMVSGFFEGFCWEGTTYYSYARDCFATNCAHAGYSLISTNNCVLDNCRAIGAYSNTFPLGPMQYGAYITGGSSIGLGNRIIGGSFEYFSKSGVYVDGGGPVSIIGGPYFETQQSASGFAHIEVGATSEVRALTIEGAYLQGDGTAGFDAIKLGKLNTFHIHGCRFGINGAIGISSTADTSGGFAWGNYNSPAGTFSLPADTVTSPGGAPTTADYLVGTAQAGLSAEIVVGTSPGGELGGSWASPTVDATHAGSTHVALSSATPLVESGSGSAGSGTSASKDDHVHPAAASGSHILVADGHANPFAFTDLLQADDGSDFLWSD